MFTTEPGITGTATRRATYRILRGTTLCSLIGTTTNRVLGGCTLFGPSGGVTSCATTGVLGRAVGR